MKVRFRDLILSQPGPVGLPVGVYAGLALTGGNVQDVVTGPTAQVEAIQALQERYDSQILLTAMDLSAEAEVFGCPVVFSPEEIPTVAVPVVTSVDGIVGLPVPELGGRCVSVYLEVVRQLRQEYPDSTVLGGAIGPFTLAGRLMGVSQALELTLENPEAMEELVAKSAVYLGQYLDAYRQAGADGVIMAEPAAGLLSPGGLARFSADPIRQMIEGRQTDHFSLFYHNCGARLAHLENILGTGAAAYHFGVPMDLGAAAERMGADVILAGNLDPVTVFLQGDPASVTSAVNTLAARIGERKNFIFSSGCDLPPGTPLANLDAFYAAVNQLAPAQIR